MATDNPQHGAEQTRTPGNQGGQAEWPGTAGGEQKSSSTGSGSGTGGTDPALDAASKTAATMGDAVRTAASDLLGQVKHQATAQAAAQKERAAESLAGVAEAVREAGDRLRDQAPGVASYVDSAVNQIEELSTTLREKDPEEFLYDLEDLARRRPALFIGGAFLLGLAVARFLKSSSGIDRSWQDEGTFDEERRGHESYATGSAGGYATAVDTYGLEQG
jgi:hypothetical protein